jgi:hypothetical protein
VFTAHVSAAGAFIASLAKRGLKFHVLGKGLLIHVE